MIGICPPFTFGIAPRARFRYHPTQMERIRASWTFIREQNLRTLLRELSHKDAHPLLQFFKYGLCGLFAVAVHNLAFAALSHWIYPAIDMNLGDSVRALRATVNNCIAFLFSNLAAYYSNVKWVFVQGRHRPLQEFLLFTLISSLSFIAALVLVPILIKGLSLQTWIAQGAFVASATLINYVSRKFLVFQR